MSARPKNPTERGNPPGPSTDEIPTKILGPEFANNARAKSKTAKTPKPPVAKQEPAKPMFQAVSMKTPHDSDAPRKDPDPPVLPHVKLRAMSEVARAQTPQNLGNLAPPYDPHQARKSAVQTYVIWGCIGVIIASAIALVVWFVGR